MHVLPPYAVFTHPGCEKSSETLKHMYCKAVHSNNFLLKLYLFEIAKGMRMHGKHNIIIYTLVYIILER